MPKSDGRPLEQLVERIHSVIEPDATVTWNAKVRDPDTNRLRQVDVLILRDGHSIHVECRDHSTPQDVKWIEELIGRKASLNADSMIGVSTSGFTRTARSKAEAKGIFLREFTEITDEELKSWGQMMRAYAQYIEFSDIIIKISLLKKTSNIQRAGKALHDEFRKDSWNIMLFQNISEEIIDNLEGGQWHGIKCNISVPANRIGRLKIKNMEFQSSARIVEKNFPAASILSYETNIPEDMSKKPIVERRENFIKEVIRSSNVAAVTFDISHIEMPINHYLSRWGLSIPEMTHLKCRTIGSGIRFSGGFDMRISLKMPL